MTNGGMAQSEFELSPINQLVTAYSGAHVRPWFTALFAFDQQLGRIIRDTKEPLLGQMRFTWWQDVIAQPAASRPKGNPVLAGLSQLLDIGLDARRLTKMGDGWQYLLGDNDLTRDMVNAYAKGRGEALFGAIADAAKADNIDDFEELGRLYALWDLARYCSDAAMADHLKTLLQAALPWLKALKIPRDLRPFSIFRHLIRLDISNSETDLALVRPRTAMRIIYYGVSGR